MSRYELYNDDCQVAMFSMQNAVITEFAPLRPELLPMQIRHEASLNYVVN